jgi:cytochrome c553
VSGCHDYETAHSARAAIAAYSLKARRIVVLLAVAATSQGGAAPAQPAHDVPPYWAFAVDPPAAIANAAAQPLDNTPRRVPNSPMLFDLERTKDLFNTPDWHPDDHPTMPDVVAFGRKPEVFACAYCHLPNGQGRPENAGLAGLPADYIVEQIAEFKSGRRKSSEPRHKPTALMIASETKAGDEAIETAARYFSGLHRTPWIRVVETSRVARTHVAGWMLVSTGGAGTEPIGRRIIETPENLERTELRDDSSGFIAYVPEGSLKKGELLVRTGAPGRSVPCAACHGAALKGIGNVPAIAGRSPSYLVRQLYDIQHGARRGAAVALMKAPVARLSISEMISIAAYAASLPAD